MTPLTEDCARIRGLLPGYHDHDLLEGERARVEAHVSTCRGCAESLGQLQGALSALKNTVSAEDLVRLRAAGPELDASPLARLALVLGLCLVGAVGLAVVRSLRPPALPVAAPGPTSTTLVAAPTPLPVIPAPLVGGSVGLEEDPALLALLEAPPAPPPAVAPPPEPAPVAVAPEPPAPPKAAPPPPPDPAPAPAPPPAARAIDPPVQLPQGARELLTRVQVSDGLGYRGLILFFLRDPDGRDRLARAAPGLPIARELDPPDPVALTVGGPRGDGDYLLLMGELLDAPLGLRLALQDQELGRRQRLEVGAVAFDPQRRRDTPPLLKGPVLLPGRARAALFREGAGGAVRELLGALRDPSLLELRRLREELSRVEGETRELDRRLRALLKDERGLRGVAVTVNGQPRGLDLFPSAAALSGALPRLLRAGLLEAGLEREERQNEDILGDPRHSNIDRGLRVTQERWRPLLDVLAEATEVAPGRFRSPDGLVSVEKGSLVHAYGAP